MTKNLSWMVDPAANNAEDESDRAYFGSTNDLDDLKEVNEELVEFEFYVGVEKGNP